MGNSTRQKNKRGYRKVESNDSPENSRQGEDTRHPRPRFGGHKEGDVGVFCCFQEFLYSLNSPLCLSVGIEVIELVVWVHWYSCAHS